MSWPNFCETEVGTRAKQKTMTTAPKTIIKNKESFSIAGMLIGNWNEEFVVSIFWANYTSISGIYIVVWPGAQ